jgi:lysophospholipase L1-like esterase
MAGARDAAAGGPEAGKLDGATGGGTGDFDPCPATGSCKILPLGDSITAGAGAQPGDNGGYRTELFTKAVGDDKHITFVGSLTSGPSTVAGVAFPKNHEGHIGYKIDQISALATTAQALKDAPHIVLLLAGTNDEGYADSQAGASDRLGLLIDKIVAALPDSLLVVASIYPFPGCKATNYTPTECAANVATYDAAIPGVIKQRTDKGKHVLFVDMSGLPSAGLSTDGVHPNGADGYPWLGDNWYGVIKPYLH